MNQEQRALSADLPRRRFLKFAAAGTVAVALAGGQFGKAQAATDTRAAGEGVEDVPMPVGALTSGRELVRQWRAVTAAVAEVPNDPGAPLDAARRAAVIDRALPLLERHYVFADVAVAMGQTVRQRQAAGAYDALADPAAFAQALADDLRAVSRDKHLRVDYQPQPLAPLPEPTPEEIERVRRELALFGNLVNHGFARAERLPGNIGFLEHRAFMEPEFAATAAARAMGFLAETFVLIVDLRRNFGGSPAMVAHLASYLLDPEPIVLNRIHYRAESRTEEFRTQRDLPGPRYGANKRVYILTSKDTPSAAEEFAYDLQALGRATIVGEVTWGGANPAGGFPIDEHFLMAIPIGRAINPITGTNWEGVGVKPDWAVPAADALRTAQVFALNNVLTDFGNAVAGPQHDMAEEARQALAELTK